MFRGRHSPFLLRCLLFCPCFVPEIGPIRAIRKDRANFCENRKTTRHLSLDLLETILSMMYLH